VPRIDEYLVDRGQPELGVKKRGGGYGVEIKGLVALGGQLASPLNGRVQIWTKWLSETLTIDHLPLVSVKKTRWLRTFATSASPITEVRVDEPQPLVAPLDRWRLRGCQCELTAVTVDDEPTPWWTVAFEAFGDVETVEDDLHRTLARVAPPPQLASGLTLSYPEWLAQFAGAQNP
jgi:hypothetical protein